MRTSNISGMEYTFVLVSSDNRTPLQEKHLEDVTRLLPVHVLGSRWLSSSKAAEILLSEKPAGTERLQVERYLATDRIDTFCLVNDEKRKKQLLISDMDNTMVVGETLDDLAAASGLKEQIAAITDKAMRGEIEFQAALRTRVAMLRGMQQNEIEVTADAIRIAKGAEKLISTMRNNGAVCVLVSGGFTCFTEPIAKKLGFTSNHGNILEIEGGCLTGEVREPILDNRSKLALLQQYSSSLNLILEETMAVGDGANDLDMILAAGFGVGYHPKPFLKERVENSILYGDLSALLYAQGYSDL